MAKKGTSTPSPSPSKVYSTGEANVLYRTVKSRVISVRLISMAMTGFFYQFSRPRTSPPMSMLKYDPVGTWKPRTSAQFLCAW